MTIDETLLNISKIIERDRKDTTYKFALLRGTIDIIQDNSPYIIEKGDTVVIPLGLLIEKWLLYYYSIFESETYIPQKNGDNKPISFCSTFKEIISFYAPKGGFSVFYNELKSKNIDPNIGKIFFLLVKDLKDTISKMPMKYIGGSISSIHYSIFKYYKPDKFRNTDQQNVFWIIQNCGTFSIPLNYFKAFRILGSFISGTDNLLFKWADFSVRASKKVISTEKVIHELLKNPITQRDVANSKKMYLNILRKSNSVKCVWSDSLLSEYDIDHMIPFSIWKNNDLWNLLPTKKSINSVKKDKIPSLTMLQKQKDSIIYYWELISEIHTSVFFKELQVSLLGNLSKENWQNKAFNQLLNTSKYLIETRGYDEWKM